MSNLRVLYVASEIAPFLSNFGVAKLVGELALAMQEREIEIRVLVPRFGVIGERKNRLHEVVRLSGTSIKVDNEERILSVKVAVIPGSRLQVYFIDNEDYFYRKAVLLDEENKFFEDNDERLIFLCKGALETVKNLEWAPDIVHCHDWITSLIPLYLKTTFKNDPIFQRAKVLFTAYDNAFSHRFGKDFAEKARIIGIEDHLLAPLAAAGFGELMKAAAQYADVVVSSEKLGDNNFKELFGGAELSYIANDEQGIEAYYKLYNELASSL